MSDIIGQIHLKGVVLTKGGCSTWFVRQRLQRRSRVDEAAIEEHPSGMGLGGRGIIGRNHHAAMNTFIAKTQGTELVQVRPLGVIAPQPGCSLAGR